MGDYCKSTLELMTVDWDIVVLGVTAADDDDDGGDGEAVPASPGSFLPSLPASTALYPRQQYFLNMPSLTVRTRTKPSLLSSPLNRTSLTASETILL